MSFSLSVRQVDGAAIVDLSGRFAAGEAVQTFQQALRAEYDQGQRSFVINLAEASYIDSSALGAMITNFTSIRKLREKSGKGNVVLLNVSRFKQLLTITCLYRVFEAFEDEAEAVAAART
jgi:anti-sigma B factor antagonist